MSVFLSLLPRVWALGVVATVCACAAESASPTGDGGASDVAASDAAGNDVTLEGGASACRPGDVTMFQPDSYRFATAPGRGVCVAGKFGFDPVQAFYDACLGAQATAGGCTAFKSDPATSACAQCIVTPDTSSHLGPLIDHGGFITANVAGCIEVTDPNGLSCAKALQALSGCELLACEANCPVHDTASRAAYDSCASQADQGGCEVYAKAAACTATEADSGLVSPCLASSFATFYSAVVPLFCGPPMGSTLDGGLVFDASSPDGSSQDASSEDGPLDEPADGALSTTSDAGPDHVAVEASPDAAASDD